MPDNQYSAAGNKYSFLAFMGDRYMLGKSRTAPSTGATGSGMYRLLGIKEVPLNTPIPTPVQVTGDDGLVAEYDFGSNESRAYLATMAVFDTVMAAALTDAIVVTKGGVDMLVMDEEPAGTAFDVCLIHQSLSKRYPDGREQWAGDYVPRATARIIARQGYSERTGAVFGVYIAPQIGEYDPLGVTFTDAVFGKTTGRRVPFKSRYPITLHRWGGTGAIATFNTDYPPAGASYFAATANGIDLTVSSVSETGKTVTFSGNPADAAAVIGMYGFTPS